MRIWAQGTGTRWKGALIGLALSAAALLAGDPLPAATITVNILDSTVGDDGVCSLREAIVAANTDAPVLGCAAGSGPDTIVLTGDIELTEDDHFRTALPNVTSAIAVRGNGHSISRNSSAVFRIFWVGWEGRLTLRNLTIRDAGGEVSPSEPFTFAGGAIQSLGTLRLARTSFESTRAEIGGAVYTGSESTLEVNDSVFVSNLAEAGGAIYIEGTAVISDSSLASNRAGAGGALSNFGDTTLDRVLVHANQAGQGGGIFNINYGGSPGLLDLRNTTISGNVASDSGPPHPDILPNLGGGLMNGGTATLAHATFVDNQVSGVGADGGGIYLSNPSSITLGGTLLAESSGANCSGFGQLSSAGNNLSDDDTCGPIAATDPSLLQVAILADNGGPTQTHALQPGNLGIDGAGDCGLLTDQRGALRDAACDVGAYEAVADDRHEISGSNRSDDDCFGHAIELGLAERHLHTADFTDWVWFQPLEGATYEIETSRLIGGSDTVLELWNDCTSPKLAEDDDGGVGLASRITYTANVNDELQGLDVHVRDLHGQGVHRGYDLTVTCISDCPACPLGGGPDFVLLDETILTHREIEACSTIVVFDSVVESGAHAVLTAGGSIVLGDGFAVSDGASLVLGIDPDLQ